MCRLLGYVNTQPTSVRDALGSEAFDAFTALTCVHGDGWGMAWRDDQGHTQTRSAPDSAASDADFLALSGTALSSAGFLHLRWATDGLPVAPENTHPFSSGQFAMAHNGSIKPMDRLRNLLSPASLEAMVGVTDSEMYFRFILEHISSYGENEGIAMAVKIMSEQFPTSSLNALLLSESALYAIHMSTWAPPPIEDLRVMFEDEDDIPHGHADAYFDMAYDITEDSVHIVSSGLVGDHWLPVPRDTILRIDLLTREVTTL